MCVGECVRVCVRICLCEDAMTHDITGLYLGRGVRAVKVWSAFSITCKTIGELSGDHH